MVSFPHFFSASLQARPAAPENAFKTHEFPGIDAEKPKTQKNNANFS